MIFIFFISFDWSANSDIISNHIGSLEEFFFLKYHLCSVIQRKPQQ